LKFCWFVLVNKDRFEETVIEERRRTAQDLLNFVGQRVYLTNSVVFKQFFQVSLIFFIIITVVMRTHFERYSRGEFKLSG